MSDGEELPEIVQTAGAVVRMLDAAVEILQAAQSTVPPPTLEEIAEIRQRRRPLTREAYLLGIFQRAIVAAENVASDLQAIDLETLSNVHELQLSMTELNAIEEAVVERLRVEEASR